MRRLFFSSVVYTWLAGLILLVMFALALTSMVAESPTFDEQGFLVRGVAYLRGEENGSRRIRVGHPLGLNALNSFLLAPDPTVRLPTDHPSWQETSFHRPAELFLWEIGNDVGRIMFLGRLPSIWLGLLMAALGARWAIEIAAEIAGGGKNRSPAMTGSAEKFLQGGFRWAGLFALSLIAFDPNILAHMRLATTDLGLAATALLAGFMLWRFLRRPAWREVVMAGVALGLLQNTKFTALLFIPLFGLIILIDFWRVSRDNKSDLPRLGLMTFVAYPLVALFSLWAMNGFQVGVLSAPWPALSWLGETTLPLSHHLDQLLDIGGRLQFSTPSFLMGRYSDSGWWYYFPVAFLLKTPIPSLLLMVWAFIWMVRRFRDLGADSKGNFVFNLSALLIPPVGYFLIALTSEINLGYRHLLPVLPFLFVFTGVSLGNFISFQFAKPRRNGGRYSWAAAIGLLGCLAIISLWRYPHYLSFFNLLAGGPDKGWRILVDSNIDWGQDLGNLKKWMNDNEVNQVWLSYFGEARPEYYDIAYIGLDSFPPRLMNPNVRPFYPHDPAPGWYAISATTLQGVHFADHDQFDYFRSREPVDKVGHSIFLYEQPALGPPVDVLLASGQIDELAPDDFNRMGSNQAILHWFDGHQSIVLPDGGRPVWLIQFEDNPLNPELEAYFSPKSVHESNSYRMSEVVPNIPNLIIDDVVLSKGDGRVAQIGVNPIEADGEGATVTTFWRQEGEPMPVKIFVHMLDIHGNIVAQWDGIGAAWEGWRDGDMLVQLHDLTWPDTLVSGAYRLVTGLYDPETNQRWRTFSGEDVVELGDVIVP
ncbi:MAG: glycosyltransferase family 39 protein [Chloroflexota bacterium]